MWPLIELTDDVTGPPNYDKLDQNKKEDYFIFVNIVEINHDEM